MGPQRMKAGVAADAVGRLFLTENRPMILTLRSSRRQENPHHCRLRILSYMPSVARQQMRIPEVASEGRGLGFGSRYFPGKLARCHGPSI